MDNYFVEAHERQTKARTELGSKQRLYIFFKSDKHTVCSILVHTCVQTKSSQLMSSPLKLACYCFFVEGKTES